MKKKFILTILIILLVAIAIGGAYTIDMNRMKNNNPVVSKMTLMLIQLTYPAFCRNVS